MFKHTEIFRDSRDATAGDNMAICRSGTLMISTLQPMGRKSPKICSGWATKHLRLVQITKANSVTSTQLVC